MKIKIELLEAIEDVINNGPIALGRLEKAAKEWKQKENLHLISAAPELLEALKEAVSEEGTKDDFMPVWMEKAYRAIAKAEGK